jgi:hypothetical protein
MVHSLELRSPLMEQAELDCTYLGLERLEAMYEGRPGLWRSYR